MTWNKKWDEVHKPFDELSRLLKCNDYCEKRCVFPDVGTGAGCPLNEFEDRVMDALGIRIED